MHIRLIMVTVVAVMSARVPLAGQQIPANDSARVETVKKLFAVTRVEQFHTQMLEMMLERYAQVPSLAPYAEPMREFLAKHASYSVVEGDLIATYREYYSETEVQQLIRFYESPLGQRVAAVTPVLSARLSQITSDKINRLLPELMRELSGRKIP